MVKIIGMPPPPGIMSVLMNSCPLLTCSTATPPNSSRLSLLAALHTAMIKVSDAEGRKEKQGRRDQHEQQSGENEIDREDRH